MASKVKRSMTDIMMLVGGGVVGAGLGLLFAPYSGAKSRRKMARMGKTVTNKSDKLMRGFSDTMSDFSGMVDTVSGKASKMLHIRH